MQVSLPLHVKMQRLELAFATSRTAVWEIV
jgi:hypothetical protein